MKARNFIFTTVFCCLLVGPTTLFLGQEEFHLDLPGWLTAENANYLSGGITQADVKENLSIEGFVAGALQKAIENEVGNHIPCKATALLGNAALQREAIAASNALFNWDVYPAFYGSSYLVVPRDHRMLKQATKATEEILGLGEEVAEAIGSLSERWPGTNVYIYLAADSAYLDDAPNTQAISNPLTYSQMRSMFASYDGNLHWIDGNVSYKDYNDLWFRSDHHWTAEGAWLEFQQIAQAMNLDIEQLGPVEIKELERPLFYGTRARRALNPNYPDHLSYIKPSNLPEIEVNLNGTQGDLDDLVHWKKYDKGKYNKNKFANHYGNLFHTDLGVISIENSEATNNESLILVSDSYSNCMEYLFTPYYRDVIACDPRHTDDTLEQIKDETENVKDILFLVREDELFSDDMLSFVR